MAKTLQFSIAKVVKDKLCCECGTCEAVCPTSAITLTHEKNLKYKPTVNATLCKNCGICLKVCPGRGFLPFDGIVGDYIEAGIYQCNDFVIMDKAASGGVGTALLNLCLEEGITQGCIVTKMEGGEPRPTVSRDSGSNIKAAGSVYQTVPTNKALKEVLQKEIHTTFIGLPCHVHGLMKAKGKLPELGKYVPLSLGLFCSIGRTQLGTWSILKRLKINTHNVREMYYRRGSYPGLFQVFEKGGKEISFSYQETLSLLDFLFFPWRCLTCRDLYNAKSDISLGDPWGLEGGTAATLVITRTPAGMALMNKALELGMITKIRDVTESELVNSREHSIRFKYNNIAFRAKILKGLGFQLPDNFKDYKKQSNFDTKLVIGNFLLILNALSTEKKFIADLIALLPLKVVRKYRSIVASWVSR